ncbi:MAG: tpiA [Acidimicrobiales bacterium]|nr:tpiA [Acidimicrobiales bacterium]
MPDPRRPLVSGNWKMHLTHFDAIRLVQQLSYALTKDDYAAVDVAVHPPFTALRSVQTVLDADDIPIGLGAQHCHWETSGAFTGEVSPAMLAKLDVRYVIVGHSERRALFGQTDEDVARTARAVQAAGMVPLVCVGETLEEREAGRTEERVTSQARAALEGMSAEEVGALVLAYEPVWAIGTGRNATAEDASSVCGVLRGLVGELAGADAAASVRIQYGGSVKPSNAAELLGAPDVDGALVGGASLEADDFGRIVRAAV